MDDNYGFIYKPPSEGDISSDLLKEINDSWRLNFMGSEYEDSKIQCEWGSSHPIRFGGMHVTMNDSEDEEIEIPKCPKCDVYMNRLIGKESLMWLCPMGCDNG